MFMHLAVYKCPLISLNKSDYAIYNFLQFSHVIFFLPFSNYIMRKLAAFLEQLLDFGLKEPPASLFMVRSQKKILSMKVKCMSMCGISQEITWTLMLWVKILQYNMSGWPQAKQILDGSPTHMEVGGVLEHFNAVADYSVWDFTAISIWVKTDFVFKIKALFFKGENNYFSHVRKSVSFHFIS